MPHSYSAIWVHVIWSTKTREPIITNALKDELYKEILAIAQNHEIFIDCINGVEDHVHLLIRLRTDQSVADVVKTIKGGSWEYFRNDPDKYIMWQDGFAVFSVSPGNLRNVRSYIYNQVKHHKGKDLAAELKAIKDGIKSLS